MKRVFALTLALLITLLIALNVFTLTNLSPSDRRSVTVTRTIDGDTLVFDEGTTARLVNINTPEKGETGYTEASAYLALLQNESVEIEEIGEDRYGRLLVRIFSPDYVNLKIVEEGLGTKFLVQGSELKEFDGAESAAVSEGRGLWKRSHYYGCLEAEILPGSEIISFTNSCNEIDLQGFTVRDESRKRYKFSSIKIGEVNLHTGEGLDNETDVYWGSAQNVWNDDRDTLYVLDSQDSIVLYKSYGY